METNKFEVGDHVKCVDSRGTDGSLCWGGVYTVSSFDQTFVRIVQDERGHRDFGWHYYRFVKADQSLTKGISDGGKSSYYQLPEHAKELRHLISERNMSFARGNLFKACYRLGEKNGVDVSYDLNKMKFFIDDMIEMNKRGEKI